MLRQYHKLCNVSAVRHRPCLFRCTMLYSYSLEAMFQAIFHGCQQFSPCVFGLQVDPSDYQPRVVFSRMVQSTPGPEQDSEFDNNTRSGAQQSHHLPTQLRIPPEVDFTGPNPGSTVDYERTDSVDRSDASRTAPSRRLVQQAARARATRPVADNTRRRCPPAPTLAEIRSHITEIRESILLREAAVAAAPAASTREVISSASLAGNAAPETGVDPGEEAAASVATVDRLARSPACAPADPAVTSVAGTGFRQGRTYDKVGVYR